MPPELVRRLCETLVDSMAELHALDYRAAGLDDLGKPQGYVERQVTGWTKRVPRRPHRRRPRPGADDRLAGRATGRPSRAARR